MDHDFRRLSQKYRHKIMMAWTRILVVEVGFWIWLEGEDRANRISWCIGYKM